MRLDAKRAAAACLLLGALLVGLAQVALLPPWEGFDDAGHYSYIQQLADKGTRAHFRDRISAEIHDYLKVAPGPLTLNPRWSYRDFFGGARADIESVRTLAHAGRDPQRAGAMAPWAIGKRNSRRFIIC